MTYRQCHRLLLTQRKSFRFSVHFHSSSRSFGRKEFVEVRKKLFAILKYGYLSVKRQEKIIEKTFKIMCILERDKIIIENDFRK